MTAVMALINFFRRLPTWAYGVVAVAGIGYVFWSAGTAFVANIRADERARTLQEGEATDDVVLRWQRESYQRQLDSVRLVAARLRDSVRVEVREVRRWTPLIPDSLRAKYAAVDSLVQSCTRLARDCDSLHTVTAKVDTLTDTIIVVDEARIRQLQLGLVRRDDRIKVLEAKTCRLETMIGTSAGVGVGYLLRRIQ